MMCCDRGPVGERAATTGVWGEHNAKVGQEIDRILAQLKDEGAVEKLFAIAEAMNAMGDPPAPGKEQEPQTTNQDIQ